MSNGTMETVREINGEMQEARTISGALTIPPTRTMGGSYIDLTDKPSINSFVIEGDKVGADYRLQDKMDALSVQEIERILYLDL